MPTILEIFCDESGHTGPDLLHREQRYFGFGSVAISDDEAYQIIAKSRQKFPVQMPELKATKLLHSANGRSIVLDVFRASNGRFAVNFHDKLLALCGWIFEYIYEPVYKRDPRILYQKNFHRFVAMYAWLWFSDNRSDAEESIRQFQIYMRTLNESEAPILFDRVNKPVSKGEKEHPFNMILRFARGYRDIIIEDNADLISSSADGGRWVLDLSISALWSHLNFWGQKDRPLLVRCDTSKPLEAYADKLSGDK